MSEQTKMQTAEESWNKYIEQKEKGELVRRISDLEKLVQYWRDNPDAGQLEIQKELKERIQELEHENADFIDRLKRMKSYRVDVLRNDLSPAKSYSSTNVVEVGDLLAIIKDYEVKK